jgi:hypothetical protein
MPPISAHKLIRGSHLPFNGIRHKLMRCTPIRCILMKYTPITCTPITCTLMRCTPMRCMLMRCMPMRCMNRENFDLSLSIPRRTPGERRRWSECQNLPPHMCVRAKPSPKLLRAEVAFRSCVPDTFRRTAWPYASKRFQKNYFRKYP